jgi:hypothetical protein
MGSRSHRVTTEIGLWVGQSRSWIAEAGDSSLLLLSLEANSHIPSRAHAIPLPCHAAKGLDCVLPIWFTQCGSVRFTHATPHPCHSTTMPFWKRLLKATAQHSMGMAWHVWISICRPEMACGRPARVQLLPSTTWSSTKVVIRSIPIH